MKIVCCADFHGNLNVKIPKADLLLIAGDLCPTFGSPDRSCIFQEKWLDSEFRYWLANQPVKECVAIAGNHCWIWDKAPAMVPRMNANFHYLCDSDIEIMGLKIYGTPQQKYFNNWAFNRTPEQLERYYANIPEGLDILLSHTGPFGIMDKVDFPNFKRHEGGKILKRVIKEMKEPPKWVIFGHFHSQYGIEEIESIPGVKFMNCSLVNEEYKLVKEPICVEL